MNGSERDSTDQHERTLRVLEEERASNVKDCFIAMAVAMALALLAFWLPSVPTIVLLAASVLILSIYIYGTMAGHRRIVDLRKRMAERE